MRRGVHLVICLAQLAGAALFFPTPVSGQIPASLVELSFSENGGMTTTNSGFLGGVALFAPRDGWPLFSTNAPRGAYAPANNLSAVDCGTIGASQGGRAIDLTTAADAAGSLGTLNRFTVCGWLNCRDWNEGWGGNRIAFALQSPNGSGFDLVQTAHGALRIGINQWPDGSSGGGPYSSVNKVPVDPQAGANNWVFFAVTYDPALSSGQVKYYFGGPNQLAALDVARDYSRGVVAASGSLTCGNFNAVVSARTETGSGGGSRVFRGLFDELRVFAQVLSLAEIQTMQQAPAWTPMDGPPVLTEVLPVPGATVRHLHQVEVVFSEPVQGVEAADLRINGTAATSVLRVASDDYLFSFPEPPAGTVVMSWATGHGIRDFANPPNSFGGGAWTNTLHTNLVVAPPRITEFMADNKKTLQDEEGDSPDWIEIFNPDAEPVNLAGYFLTDRAAVPTQWRFPAVVLPPNEYLVIFASAKNRTNPAAPLHTNFKLNKDGSYLGLLDSRTNVVSEFPPPFLPQQEDVSYGRDQLDPNLLGYFLMPTPGRPNAASGAGFAPEVEFSQSSGTFMGPFLLSLSAAHSNAVIRYVLVQDAVSAANTNLPGPASPLYTGPLQLTNSVQVRARAFVPNLLPGPPRSETFLRLNSSLAGVSSDLPIVVIHTLGSGDFNQSVYKGAHLSLYEPVLGRTRLTNAPTLATRAAFRVRGNSTAGAPKKPWSVQLLDEWNQERDLPVLEIPAESDWVLYAPTDIEPVLIHNPFAYELARRLGQYAPRTRFVEVYLNTGGGALSSANYNGLYVLEEKIKISPQRVDIDPLQPQHTNAVTVTGGYLLQVDRLDAGQAGFRPPGVPKAITYVQPKESEITLPQRDPQEKYIYNYLSNFVAVLNSAGFADPVTGYAQFVDCPAAIDNHLVKTFCFTVDAFDYSTYFSKARGGKLCFGPVWDFDRSLESAGDPRDDNPRTWRYAGSWEAFDFFNYSWWGRLFRDIDFWQKWVDRYQEVRASELSAARLAGLVDELARQVREAQGREVVRWAGYTTPRGGSYQWEIDHMKEWMTNRLHFMDTNFLPKPVIQTSGGYVSPGFTFQIAGPLTPANTQVYYTLDGTDPRLPGGAVAPGALLYSGPVTITNNAWVVARSRNVNHRNLTGGSSNGNPPLSTPWSGPAQVVLVVNEVPLVITEMMYHPAPGSAGNTNEADDFEFIELKNIGTTSLNLAGVRFTRGIDYTFTAQSAVTNLAPGGTVLLVRNRAAFLSRYPGATAIAGEYAGSLANEGERLVLVGARSEPVLDFSYSDQWYPLTDGAGFSLGMRNEQAPRNSWGLAASWRSSAAWGGSPGFADAAPPAWAPVVINEALTHTDSVLGDAIELYNPGATNADISGWFLTDDFSIPRKYCIPTNSVIRANDYLVFYESNTFGLGAQSFALNAAGDQVYLFSGTASGELTGYVQGFEFGAQVNGATFGRCVISTGEEQFPRQQLSTLGGPNAGPLVGPVVISEIHYHPPDLVYPGGAADNTGDEYVELHNLSSQPVLLFDPAHPTNTWHVRDAIAFEFPPGMTLPPQGFALLVSFNPANSALSNQFAARMGLPAGVPLCGPFRGKLDNHSASVELARPDTPPLPPAPEAGVVSYVLADKVKYHQELPWPAAADGLGPSLQRTVESAYGNDPANWQATTPTPGTSYLSRPLPVMLQPPTGLTNPPGSTAVFQVVASSSSPLQWQWRFNGSSLPGATNATLMLTNLQPAQAGAYSVILWNAGGSVASAPAVLAVCGPATIQAPPANLSVRIRPDPQALPTTNATFRVVARSASPLRYQWCFNGVDLPGATLAALTITNVQASAWGEYQVAITDAAGTIVSPSAWLFPCVSPVFMASPLSQAVAVGGTATLSAAVRGWPPPFTFEWWRGNQLLASNVQHEPVSFFPLTAPNTLGSVSYRAVVKNQANLAGLSSANATITMLADNDHDGIPDAWWAVYGLAPASRGADADNDGLLNGQEYCAGTNPTNAASGLWLQSMRLADRLVFNFEAVSNHTYTLQCTFNPASQSWFKLADFAAQVSNRLEPFTNALTETNCFYRVVTPQQP